MGNIAKMAEAKSGKGSVKVNHQKPSPSEAHDDPDIDNL